MRAPFRIATVLLLTLGTTGAQTTPSPDPLAPLDFLLGSWKAQTSAAGSSAAASTGVYTFRRDLAGHVLTRTSSTGACNGPQSFDCQHHDQLTIFSEPGDPVLHALYLDSEGHVIHYDLSRPDPRTVLFLSRASAGPVFRLTYHLEGTILSGKFQAAAPGTSDFHSYLEWSGPRQP